MKSGEGMKKVERGFEEGYFESHEQAVNWLKKLNI